MHCCCNIHLQKVWQRGQACICRGILSLDLELNAPSAGRKLGTEFERVSRRNVQRDTWKNRKAVEESVHTHSCELILIPHEGWLLHADDPCMRFPDVLRSFQAGETQTAGGVCANNKGFCLRKIAQTAGDVAVVTVHHPVERFMCRAGASVGKRATSRPGERTPQ